MSTNIPVTTYLKDYKTPDFAVEQITLEFELNDTVTLVKNTMHLQRQNPQANDLKLDGESLALVSINLNNQLLNQTQYQLNPGNLVIHNVPDCFTLEIVTQIKPQENTQLQGLYRSNHMFCTQCEAQGFRRITYFLDRPDVLTRYTTKIIADKIKYPVLLSNGNLIDQGDIDNRHWVTWQDPFNKPCYLFALVAGNLACVTDTFTTRSNRVITIKIYVEHGNQDKCAHALASLKKAMRWDEEVYGREYDLDIFMIVAVSDFNMGAMENKGLNIFNAKYILARPETASDIDFAQIESVVAHEYFHNWTGNRVTCRDWFQLSLKEGLTIFRDQEFSRDMNSRDVNRINDVIALRNQQFPEDASPMAHPVRPESYIEINNFYTATVYNKGAEVIRMQHTILGAAGFRKGMDLYFERHDGNAVTIDDFVAAMEDANGVDFSQLKRWYSQAGTPQVTAKIAYDEHAARLQITLSQALHNSGKDNCLPWQIPIKFALFDKAGKQISLDTEILELKELTQQFIFNNITQSPIISLLRDFSAPIILNIDYSDANLQVLMQCETDGFARWEAAQRFANKYLQQLIQTSLSGEIPNLPPQLLSPYQAILATEIPLALQAQLLSLPKFNDIANLMQQVEVDAIVLALDYYHKFLGSNLFAPFNERYHQLLSRASNTMDAQAYATRSMQNTCLSYLMSTEHKVAIDLCHQQFNGAKTMTDEIAALALLAHVDCEQRHDVLARFYHKWHQDKLVLDKWFAVQASSKLADTLTIVQQLLSHPEFSLYNPNRVRALVGTFCMNNQRNFHKIDGSGYQFLAEFIKEIDGRNSQLAAGLVTSLLRWRAYDKNRQALMQQALQAIISQKQLSRDVYEKVSKSLGS